MKHSFIKTIQGHQLEFNKQACKGCYKVSPANVEFNSVLSLEKDEKGMWNVNETDHLPAWYNEISMYVHYAIEENETKQNNNNSAFFQFANPF